MPTRSALDGFRQALREGRTDLRLLVPTATMAEHLQHRLAREGFAFQRSLIQTLSAFVKRLTPELREVPETVLYLIVEQAARRVARPEFAAVAHMPGFCASVARVIAEFSSAGCDSARLAIGWTMGTLVSALGVYLSLKLDLPTGATIVCTFALVLIAMAALRPFVRRRLT